MHWLLFIFNFQSTLAVYQEIMEMFAYQWHELDGWPWLPS